MHMSGKKTGNFQHTLKSVIGAEPWTEVRACEH